MSLDARSAAPFSGWERSLAFRYLRNKRKNGGVALIAVISFSAITIAVAVLIIVMSVMNGFRAHLLDQMLGFAGHAAVEGDILYAQDGRDQVLQRIRAIPGVTQAVPITETQTIVQGMGTYTGVIVRGMRGESEREKPNQGEDEPAVAPDVQQACPATFGNSDIFGGSYADPTP